MATLTADNWYGCLIYAIIEKKLSGITCYTLLGYNPENLFISKKIIDILWLMIRTNLYGARQFSVTRTACKTASFSSIPLK